MRCKSRSFSRVPRPLCVSDESPLPPKPPLQTQENENDRKRRERSPQRNLAPLDDLRGREARGVELGERNEIALALLGDVFQQLGARPSILGFGIRKSHGKILVVAPDRLAAEVGLRLDAVGALLRGREFRAVFAGGLLDGFETDLFAFV